MVKLVVKTHMYPESRPFDRKLRVEILLSKASSKDTLVTLVVKTDTCTQRAALVGRKLRVEILLLLLRKLNLPEKPSL